MPKRKAAASNKGRTKRSKPSGAATCPQLPPEIWANIISLSMNIDVVLGVSPWDIHRYFLNPFMHVNQCCRQETIRLIASSAWIELKSLNHEYAQLVHTLAQQFPLIDSFWRPVLYSAAIVPRVVFEFGREIHKRSTRLHVNDTQTFLCPSSYATIVRLVSKIGPLLGSVNNLRVRGLELPAVRAREIKSVLGLLDVEGYMLEESLSTKFVFISIGKAWISMKLLLGSIVSLQRVVTELKRGKDEASEIRRKVLILYMTQYLVKDAESALDPPIWWAHKIRHSVDDDAYNLALDRVRVARILYCMEMSACDFFADLFKIDMAWARFHAPDITESYTRWITEPRFTYYGGVLEDELPEYYRKIGHTVSLYSAINSWLQEPVWRLTPIGEKLQKKTAAFVCASRMMPGNKIWKEDFEKAKRELEHHYPRYGWHILGMQCQPYVYRDIDGTQRTWYRNPVCKWGEFPLQFLHKAQKLAFGSEHESDVDPHDDQN